MHVLSLIVDSTQGKPSEAKHQDQQKKRAAQHILRVVA